MRKIKFPMGCGYRYYLVNILIKLYPKLGLKMTVDNNYTLLQIAMNAHSYITVNNVIQVRNNLFLDYAKSPIFWI